MLTKLTVNLISSAAASLDRVHKRTGLSKTDVVNRALQVYEFIDAEMAAGRDVLVRDADGSCSIVKLM